MAASIQALTRGIRSGMLRWLLRVRIMTIRLPEALRQVVQEQASEPIRMVDPGTNAEYVLVRAEVFERLGKLVDIDPADAYPLLDEAFREGWSDPKMAEYDDYESRKRS